MAKMDKITIYKVKYQLVKITKGTTTVVDSGPLSKLNSRLKLYRASTRKGSMGRGRQRHSVEYKIIPALDSE